MTDAEKALIATATKQLDDWEAAHPGKSVDVTVEASVASGNCLNGVLMWREQFAQSRRSVPAREMLQIIAKCGCKVDLAVAGVRKAIELAK